MVSPIPGASVHPKFKAPNTGSWNACDWHTGQDYAADYGTPILAARSGSVHHVSMGSAFGGHQFVIRPGDGTQDFYAHTGTRPAHGAWVNAGQQVATVDAEGNATGPHLHLERHLHASDHWPDCSGFADPMLSHNHGGDGDGSDSGWMFPSGQPVYAKYLKWKGHEQNADGVSDSIMAWQEMLNHHSIPGGQEIPVTGAWYEMTANETRLCQRSHIPPEDPYPEGVFVGQGQWNHVKGAVGCPYTFVE